MFAFVFDSIGGGEWLVLLAVVLIIVGPKNLPSAARKMGEVMSKLRRAADEFKRQLLTMDEEIRKTADNLKQEYIDVPDDPATGDRAVSESSDASSSVDDYDSANFGDDYANGNFSDGYPGPEYYGMTDENGLEVSSTEDGVAHDRDGEVQAAGADETPASPETSVNADDGGNTTKA